MRRPPQRAHTATSAGVPCLGRLPRAFREVALYGKYLVGARPSHTLSSSGARVVGAASCSTPAEATESTRPQHRHTFQPGRRRRPRERERTALRNYFTDHENGRQKNGLKEYTEMSPSETRGQADSSALRALAALAY